MRWAARGKDAGSVRIEIKYGRDRGRSLAAIQRGHATLLILRQVLLTLVMRWFRRGEGDSSLDLLIAGLGNPGREYANTRHNVGFMVGDELVRHHGASYRGKFSGDLAEFRLDGLHIAVLKPQTFMNESGRSVGAAARFYKLAPESLLVVHDEVDLEPGRLQVRMGGGLAGHNGLRSLAQHLKTSDFLRLRVGVGRPERGDRRPVADFVLSPFPPELDADALVARAADAVEVVALEGLEEAQQRFNERLPGNG